MPGWIKIIGLMVFLLLAVVFASSIIGPYIFAQNAMQDVARLFSGQEMPPDDITLEQLEQLPPPVRQWLQRSGFELDRPVKNLYLEQEGRMRIDPAQPWMEFSARQYCTIHAPGFVWITQVKAAPAIFLSGRDMYYHGQGNMLIKLLGLYTIVDAEGYETDQGSMLRFLGEMVWYPSAALSPYISWEPIDTTSARATMDYRGVTASGVFVFNREGQVVEFSADRYRETGGEFVLTPWVIKVEDYQAFDGIRVPSRGTVTWKTDHSDFHWFEFRITELEYNVPAF